MLSLRQLVGYDAIKDEIGGEHMPGEGFDKDVELLKVLNRSRMPARSNTDLPICRSRIPDNWFRASRRASSRLR